jgi:hypothetical protein
VIDKESNFDLLHPAPKPKPKPPIKKLRQIFNEIQADRKLLAAELKWVCAD